MLEEKQRFRKAPYNYAMRKTQLMKSREEALAKYCACFFSYLCDLNVILILPVQWKRGRIRAADKRTGRIGGEGGYAEQASAFADHVDYLFH